MKSKDQLNDYNRRKMLFNGLFALIILSQSIISYNLANYAYFKTVDTSLPSTGSTDLLITYGNDDFGSGYVFSNSTGSTVQAKTTGAAAVNVCPRVAGDSFSTRSSSSCSRTNACSIGK